MKGKFTLGRVHTHWRSKNEDKAVKGGKKKRKNERAVAYRKSFFFELVNYKCDCLSLKQICPGASEILLTQVYLFHSRCAQKYSPGGSDPRVIPEKKTPPEQQRWRQQQTSLANYSGCGKGGDFFFCFFCFRFVAIIALLSFVFANWKMLAMAHRNQNFIGRYSVFIKDSLPKKKKRKKRKKINKEKENGSTQKKRDKILSDK